MLSGRRRRPPSCGRCAAPSPSGRGNRGPRPGAWSAPGRDQLPARRSGDRSPPRARSGRAGRPGSHPTAGVRRWRALAAPGPPLDAAGSLARSWPLPRLGARWCAAAHPRGRSGRPRPRRSQHEAAGRYDAGHRSLTGGPDRRRLMAVRCGASGRLWGDVSRYPAGTVAGRWPCGAGAAGRRSRRRGGRPVRRGPSPVDGRVVRGLQSPAGGRGPRRSPSPPEGRPERELPPAAGGRAARRYSPVPPGAESRTRPGADDRRGLSVAGGREVRCERSPAAPSRPAPSRAAAPRSGRESCPSRLVRGSGLSHLGAGRPRPEAAGPPLPAGRGLQRGAFAAPEAGRPVFGVPPPVRVPLLRPPVPTPRSLGISRPSATPTNLQHLPTTVSRQAKRAAQPHRERPSSNMSGGVLLSHAVPRAVPSALKGLTSGFGMGPGVSPSL